MTLRNSTTVLAGQSADAGVWRVLTLRGDGALSAHADEWDDLHARCSAATPFVSHAWLHSWWRSYGRRGRLVLVLVCFGDRLVAAAALVRSRRAGLPVLTLVGSGLSDFGDVLVDDSYAPEAARRLALGVAAQARGGVVDLSELRPTAAAWRMIDAWPARTWRLPASACLELPGRPIEELITALARHSARVLRRKLRKIDSQGVQTRLVGTDEAANAIAGLLRLHREEWRGRGMNPEHGQPRFATHLMRAATALVARDQAALREYRLDGQLVAVALTMIGHDVVGAYLYGFDPDLRSRIDVSMLMLRENLALTHRLGRASLSMLRGDEPHKRRLRPTVVYNQRALLAGPGQVTAGMYALAVIGRARLADNVKTRLPAALGPIRSIRSWLRSCT